ncbi:hypothetical protein Vretimale_6191 [Volvox reticuliferus]|uniref:EGF-like domain-containing protein n=2 Tax=Volvox reticuliferus TaxID=1737510 RepID=A0A8J4LKQ4_9CHLO|nr:hypothetical protein Vretifemale_7989 [Volvox reticuliferus]GIM01359.1 hypothetical protein Vretimale_6191 [Volvox reticuliferus]
MLIILVLILYTGLAPNSGVVGDVNAARRSALDLPSKSRGNQRDLLSSTDLAGVTFDSLDAVHTSSFATHPDLGLGHLFVPLTRSCHPDCTKRGNCNAEEGRCECPFGYTGPTCEEPLLPSCQRGPGLEPFFGVLLSRNCECLRQANRFFGCTPNNDTCTLLSMGFHHVQCYSFTGVPVSEQWSKMPSLDQAGVEYFRGMINKDVALSSVDPQDGMVGRDIWGNAFMNLPPEKCGQHECHGHGACVVKVPDTNLESLREASVSGNPFCMCFKGFKGHTCNEDMWELCPNRCRGRGQCIRGFCHCRPPYWGQDCSREHAWQLAPGASPVPNRHVLRIYVYELPTHIAFPVPLDDNVHDVNEQFYQTGNKFLELLLLDNDVRTENPLEANLFFVPTNSYSYSSNTNPPSNQIESALKFVATNYPYFNASGGADHIVFTTGDKGICFVPRRLSNVIHVTQFGLHTNLYDVNGTFLRPHPEHHPTWGCFHPKKDLVAAPWCDGMVGSKDAGQLYEKVVEVQGDAPQRDLLFFFAGTVRPNDMAYSGGARQALFTHLKELLASGANYSDILFVEGFTHNYNELYLRSRFCLAPHGSGFGVRLTLAMTHACIPVIIQDQVYQPYESDGLLPYRHFSLRLSLSDIPYIVPILRTIPMDQQKRMRLAMAKYYQAFLWDPSLGGRAYNYTIRALNSKLNGLWGHLWGTPHPNDTDDAGAAAGHHHRRQLVRVAWQA